MNFKHAAVVSIVAIFAVAPSAALAQRPAGMHFSSRTQLTRCTFRLQVQGRAKPGMTFWVAYGPLAGKFGLVRLQSSRLGMYTASRTFPAGGRTVLAYLSSRGTIHTPIGLAPSTPFVTIRRIGPIRILAGSIPLVRWRAPSA